MFETGGRRYACALDAVREIVPLGTAARLPGAPPPVVGLINLRGRLVTVIDLAAQLGARQPGPGWVPRGSIVILGRRDQIVGMLVDEVRDVRPVESGAIEPMQDAQSDGRDGAVRALARLEDGVATVLDTDAIISAVLQ